MAAKTLLSRSLSLHNEDRQTRRTKFVKESREKISLRSVLIINLNIDKIKINSGIQPELDTVAHTTVNAIIFTNHAVVSS